MEENPKEILSLIETCIKETIRKLEELGMSIDDIITIGVANQRETTVAWDTITGEPLYNAICRYKSHFNNNLFVKKSSFLFLHKSSFIFVMKSVRFFH